MKVILKLLSKIIIGAIIYFILIHYLKSINHYDRICFFTVVIVTSIVTIIDVVIDEKWGGMKWMMTILLN